MDFELDEQLTAVTELSERILGDRSTPQRLTEVEAGDGLDRSTWQELTRAGLAGLALPESAGGGGLGLLAAGQVADAVGRHTAAVPYNQTVVAGLALAEGGAAELAARLVDGELIGVVALDLGHDPSTTRRPALRARPNDDGWRLSGELLAVPFGAVADRLVVPASVDGGERILLTIASDADDLAVVGVETTANLPAANLHFGGVDVASSERLGGGDAIDLAADRLRLLTCRTMSGVCQGALALAASYTSEREQFGAKIGTFQAVAHRLADAYIDGQAIELTAMQATWRAEAGLDLARELSTASFWAAEGGQRIVHATQHVHGGIGVDTDYPLHRYFRWAKELELLLGGASRSLVELGATLASDPAG